MGINPITHQEITAWANGYDIRLMPFERKAIRAIDKAYISHMNSKLSKERNERE